MSWVLAIIGGLALGITSYWHIGGLGTGGRPFVIVLLAGVVLLFALSALDGAG